MAKKVLDGGRNGKQAFTKAVEFIRKEAEKKGVGVTRQNAVKDTGTVLENMGTQEMSRGQRRKGFLERMFQRETVLETVEEKIEEELLEERKRVVFLSHLPEGFTDYTLKEYFEQFGSVVTATICRSERTGRSKGYAVIEFIYPEVATIVANTMNNYVLKKRLLKAKVVEKNAEIERLLTTKVTVRNNPALEKKKKYVRRFNRLRKSVKWNKTLQEHLKEFKVKGVPYIYEHGGDTSSRYIDEQLHKMIAMKSKNIPTEDQQKQCSTEDQNKQVPFENEKDSSRHKKKPISSKDKKKEVLAEQQKKVVTEDRNKQVPLENKNKKVSTTGRKKQIPSKDKKKPVLAKQQKKVVTKVQKKLIPLCLKPAKPVLEVDESDEEIEFKTPPNAIKRRFSSFKPR